MLVTTPNTMMCLIFIVIGTSCGDSKPMVVLWILHLILADFFLFWEKTKYVQLKEMLEFV